MVGATGAVGQAMREILEQRHFPIRKLKLLASARSKGVRLPFKDELAKVEVLKSSSFKDVDIALFSAGGARSLEFAPAAAKAGAVVIDNSSAWRMDPKVPLVVPEVNPEDVAWHEGIIANPNCSTIQMVVVLKPLYDVAGIRRIVVSTYQAVSGTGRDAMEELYQQTYALLNDDDFTPKVYPHQIAFNVLPQIDAFLDNDYTKEEMKMINETRKIMHDDSIAVSATCVRVPVFVSHSEAVNIETEKKITQAKARRILKKAPGVVVVDDPSKLLYPMPVGAAGEDACYVGRIREDVSVKNGLDMWIVSDNLRKGAALNAVQIAEVLQK